MSTRDSCWYGKCGCQPATAAGRWDVHQRQLLVGGDVNQRQLLVGGNVHQRQLLVGGEVNKE
jgi:hypothetical protein